MNKKMENLKWVRLQTFFVVIFMKKKFSFVTAQVKKCEREKEKIVMDSDDSLHTIKGLIWLNKR